MSADIDVDGTIYFRTILGGLFGVTCFVSCLVDRLCCHRSALNDCK